MILMTAKGFEGRSVEIEELGVVRELEEMAGHRWDLHLPQDLVDEHEN